MKKCKCGLNPNEQQSKEQQKWEEEHIKKYGCCSCCLNEDLTEIKTIKVIGYSVGDASVGIGEIPFEIDTGLTELNDSDREFIADTMIRAIYELHDNGTIRFYFSDENTGDFDYSNVFGYNEFRATNESVKQTRQNIVRRTTNAKGQNKK